MKFKLMAIKNTKLESEGAEFLVLGTVASFALPMLFGIIIGTSSSVFIASPILYYLSQRRAGKGLAQLRPTSEEIRKELELLF